jgi:excisionase family DNA binding protein
MATDDDLLTYAQAARFLNLRLGTLYALVSRKEIPHVRLGKRLVRFSRDALTAMITDRSIRGGQDIGAHLVDRNSK